MQPRPTSPADERLVLRVNELFHDALNASYHDALPEIFEMEGDRWRRLAADFICSEQSLTLIEIGTGTGFVPLTIGPLLKPADLFICSDISAGILDAARMNIEGASFPCRFEFRKIEPAVPLRLPFDDASADFVMMNSVLHHIEDTQRFLGEIDRILRPGGRAVIAHEPNRAFYENRFLSFNYKLLDWMFNFRVHVISAARKAGFLDALRRCYYFFRPSRRHEMGVKSREQDAICANVNEQLAAEGLIEKPLSNQQILDLIDIRADEGFYPDHLFPGWRLVHLETYHHLFWVTVNCRKNGFIRQYDQFLAGKFPNRGATFAVIWEKAAGARA